MQLIERKLPFRKLIEFPEMKGRTLDKVKLSTTSDFHSLILDFQDKTSLTLVIEPCFLISANFSDFATGDQRILKRWPTIQSMTNRT
jgi:hypothetical protein